MLFLVLPSLSKLMKFFQNPYVRLLHLQETFNDWPYVFFTFFFLLHSDSKKIIMVIYYDHNEGIKLNRKKTFDIRQKPPTGVLLRAVSIAKYK